MIGQFGWMNFVEVDLCADEAFEWANVIIVIGDCCSH